MACLDCGSIDMKRTEHDASCDCGYCCIQCYLLATFESLDDNGRCEDCAQEAHEFAMADMYDRAKDLRKYGDT